MKFLKRLTLAACLKLGFLSGMAGDDPQLQKVKDNIEKHGLHIVTVSDTEQQRGFCYSIGLWERFKHPEILIFTPNLDPSGFAQIINTLSKHIESGQRFKSEDKATKAFGKFDGDFREVKPVYHKTLLGIAADYYGKPFEAIQLFWPDAAGNYPWHRDFNQNLPDQPALYQENLLLAGLTSEDLVHLMEQGASQQIQQNLSALLVAPEHLSSADMMTAWSHHIPKTARLYSATVFGDPILQKDDKSFVLLDTDDGKIYPIADKADELGWSLIQNIGELIPRNVMLHAKEQGFDLKGDQVYSWRSPLSKGGQAHLENINKVSLAVHLKHSGETHSNNHTDIAKDDGIIYEVVINDEGEYSILPTGSDLPANWKLVGKKGSKEAVIAYIAEVWQDMRPNSVKGDEQQ